MYTKKTVYTKKTYVHKKNKKKQTYICFILFFLCTQVLGLIISHCARKSVFGMRWILDLELLLLMSCIAQKWNRAKTFFVRSHSPPKNPFLQDKRFLENEVCGFSTAITRKCFYLCKPIWGGQSYCSLPFNPPNQVSSRSSTKEESLVSEDKITTSSSISSTRKESTQTGTHFDSIIKYTPNKSDILKRDTSVHISINTVRNKRVEPGSKSFNMIQSFQGSQASTSMAAHKISCNMQLQSRNIDLLSINRN
jgi:hypothetical protein